MPHEAPRMLRCAFYSPFRLVLVSLVVAGILVAGVLLATSRLQADPPAVDQAVTRPIPEPEGPARASATATPYERISARSRARVADVARAFVDVWARQGRLTPRREWLRRLQPLTTAALFRGLEATDPVLLPRGHARDVQVRQLGAFAGTALVTVSSRLQVEVELVSASGRWVVANIRPVGA